jgi:uncharacterized membrane protein YadS
VAASRLEGVVDSGAFLLNHLQRLLPGILLCCVITVAATLIETVELHFAGQPYLESLVIAILLGVAIRVVWKPGPKWIPGIAFSAKFVLECAIVSARVIRSAVCSASRSGCRF